MLLNPASRRDLQPFQFYARYKGRAIRVGCTKPDVTRIFPVKYGSDNVGIGTSAPKGRLHVNGDLYAKGHVYLHAYEGDGNSGTAYLQARDISGASTIDLQIRAQSNGAARDIARFRADGITQVNVLEIAGADVAERFPTGEELQPGMVAAIDPSNPGKLCMARGAYIQPP